ncbi:hypothetical protein BD779DRAFT_1612023 [Infundibulicybe gibba]|nr:hypothetical protein BD779DRAFT_1612023 [Infundibulicybe gibba]
MKPVQMIFSWMNPSHWIQTATHASPPHFHITTSLMYVAYSNHLATPCNEAGDDLPEGSILPSSHGGRTTADWAPYNNRIEFELAEFLYKRNQMPMAQIDTLMELWAASLLLQASRSSDFTGDDYETEPPCPPFANHDELHEIIDTTELGDIPWESLHIQYDGVRPPDNAPPWMDDTHEAWFCDPAAIVEHMLKNPDFEGEFDYKPYQQQNSAGLREYEDFMSGNWAWQQADIIAADPNTHGSMFVPIILGSDKTTVSVATGQTEYYPLYLSIGNIKNNVRRAHRNGVVLLGFLSIPKTTKEHRNTTAFRKFRRQLFHTTISAVLESLKSTMETPKVVQCPDGHFRRAIFGIGPYIADYPEQVLLGSIVQDWCARCTAQPTDLDGPAGPRTKEHRHLAIDCLSLDELWRDYGIVGDIIPFTDSFPRADINQLLAPDLLHQVIKGGFKDHLVTWVCEYLKLEHGATEADRILDDIDYRISLTPSFPGLRRFPQGRGFKQWTGDDSKALMKVYIPAIEGHVPQDMVRALTAYLDFCYLVRRAKLNTSDLNMVDEALSRFHHYRKIFQTTGVRKPGPEGVSLPRQHASKHYRELIELFGSPNGLCSSITEAKHIKAVKEPWRRSNHHNALGQMLLTNQRLDKLAASRADFEKRGMLNGTCLYDTWKQLRDRTNASNSPNVDFNHSLNVNLDTVTTTQALGTPGEFIHSHRHPNTPSSDQTIFPPLYGRTKVYHSAVAVFHAPSDPSGYRGMRREYIRSTPSWRTDGPRHDCILVSTGGNTIKGMSIARVMLLFSYADRDATYPCALVHWFLPLGDAPDLDTGMWIVEPEFVDETPLLQVIHLDTIHRLVHLLPICGSHFVPPGLHFSQTLDMFKSYYVSKHADHNAFDILFNSI